ncbi:MAG TPA: YfhO family protein [Candidatus Hydrogenedentes bacterium]|nr:YfhO family protein [Candidatus Hydrogenedentota bacterium]
MKPGAANNNMFPVWREFCLQGVLLLLLLIAAFPGIFFQGEVTVPGDILFQAPPWRDYAPEGWRQPANRYMTDMLQVFYPFYALTRQSLLQGEWPLWNPMELAGIPLMANCQSAVFYPLRLLYLFLNTDTAYTLHVLTKLWLCGMIAYLCGRRLELKRFGAALLSMGWMLNGYNTVYAYWPLADVSAWLPLLFLGVESALCGKRRHAIFAIGAAGSMMILAGHPETAFAMAFDTGIYFVLRLMLERRWGTALKQPIITCMAGWSIALLVSSIQWIPFLEYLFNSHAVAERAQEEFQSCLTPGAIIAFFIPHFYGSVTQHNFWNIVCLMGHALYPGMLIWFGVALCLAQKPVSLKLHMRHIALALTILFSILTTFNAPFVHFLNTLPLFSSMHGYYHIGFALFAVAFLGASGIDNWLEHPGPWRALLWTLPPAGAAALLTCWLLKLNGGYMHALHVDAYVYQQIRIAAALALLCFFLLALCRIQFLRVPLALGFVLLLALDLTEGSRDFNATTSRNYAYPRTDLTTFLEKLPKPCRVQTGTGGIPSGLMIPYGVEEWLGYDGLYPKRIMQFSKTLKTDLWNSIEPVCSIQYYLHNPRYPQNFPVDNPEYFEKTGTFNGIDVYRNKKALPRVFLVGNVEVIENQPELFTKLMDTAYDPSKTVVTESPPPGDLPHSDGELGNAHITHYSFTRIQVNVEANAPCTLILSDAFYPGWKAYIDGQSSEIFPAYYAFRGVLIAPGSHIVEFRYYPWTFYLGLAISAQTLIIGGLAALVTRFQGKLSADMPRGGMDAAIGCPHGDSGG